MSNDKYLKLYKIDSNLVDYNRDELENSIDLTHSKDNLFIGFNAGVYETLKSNYDDKYEYISDTFVNKNLLSDEFLGNLDLQTNLKLRNYQTNKETKFFVNNFDWKSKDLSFNSGLSSKILGNFKNINFEAKNEDIYKEDFTSEFYGALGLLTDLKLLKEKDNLSIFLLQSF